MTGRITNERDYESLSPNTTEKDNLRDESSSDKTLKRQASQSEIRGKEAFPSLNKTIPQKESADEFTLSESSPSSTSPQINAKNADASSSDFVSISNESKTKREKKRKDRDDVLLTRDRWLVRNGHTVTYIGLFLFTLTVYFRPYELIPALSGFTSLALVIAVATLFVYVPSQLATEGNITAFPVEVKCILFIAGWALFTMPIAKDPEMSWKAFYDGFAKVVIIFIVMVNSLRSFMRLKGLMWLGIGVGVMLSYQAIDLYNRGVFNTEGYRVSVDFGGMFGNPNDMSLHLVIFIPIATTLGIASKKLIGKIVYFTFSTLMITAVILTQSRGGFLGLLVMGGVLVWKLGGQNRWQIMSLATTIALAITMIAPGNFGFRILSIFVPGLDPVGSVDQRRELLYTSLLVTLRNPWGIGFANFPIVGDHNQQSHNAYTQVSSELGWLAFVAYVILIVSPFRRLGAVARQLSSRADFSWTFYLSIGLQASLAAYMTTSFFGSVAYHWYLYYPVAFAVCLRRMHAVQHVAEGSAGEESSTFGNYFKRQEART